MQDAKAAVRYFRRQDVVDSLRVDTTRIFLGGFSAGAFSTLNAACLDAGEVMPEIDTALLGNIEGNSGNPGHSSGVLALMNCWGGLLDTLIVDPGDIPVISVHGTSDPVVPYTSGISIFAGIYLYGSSTITLRLRSLGIRSYLVPMPGVGHGFPGDSVQNSFWTDTTIVSTAAFFYPFVQPTAVAPAAGHQPDRFILEQNYPNPFNPSTTIRYGLPHNSFVTLALYNTLGQQIAQLLNEQQQDGYHAVVFRGDGLASGVYYYRISVVPLARRDFVASKKLLLLK